jgi:hypothetical protein
LQDKKSQKLFFLPAPNSPPDFAGNLGGFGT